ncbi:cysteine desulfurase family protein [Pleomorphovibrio marinus]|uniref:cysteine desulfurase family protein n=1 Tax=Pleomorphovibrio marinus TaxID=2164132 RepID=UPI000E0ADBAA|nr:cysteine desulfurase family protein [Pleomorphovibrio marinus]
MQLPLYFDHNATTPCAPEVVEAMLPYFTTHFGNASSSQHAYGWLAEEAVETAREEVAKLIGASPKHLIFTSGATEAINLAIRGTAMENPDKKQIITFRTEHAAVLDTCKDMEEKGYEVHYLGVDENGLPDLGELEKTINKDTLMVIAMLANNETGVVFPLEEIAVIAHAKETLLLSDGVQAVGKIPVAVDQLQVDIMPLSGHKMYGPKGVGALYIRNNPRKVRLRSILTGGGHERGWRSGTLNVGGIVGLGAAASLRISHLDTEYKRLALLRDKLEENILKLEGTKLNGDPLKRLPHVTNISFEGVESKAWQIAINKSIACSSGSACSSITEKASHVLKAMGITDQIAKNTLRLSMGLSTTERDVDVAISHITKSLHALRAGKETRNTAVTP